MHTFAMGLICGLAVGISISAHAALIAGDGPLQNWRVIKNDRIVCESPYMWSAPKEIRCE